MAHFDKHCDDCQKILGDRCEEVNRWIDDLFKHFGPNHRRHRHCWAGVREAKRLFGEKGARAAIVHIVRDCGEVPSQRSYNKGDWVIAPMHDGLSFDSFKQIVEAEFKKAASIDAI